MTIGKLDQRGVTAFEFCLVAGVVFSLIFGIIDFARYAITVQSLRALADAGARQVMISCYTPAVTAQTPTTPSCSGDPLTTAAKQAAAPFLFAGGLSPTLTTVTGTAITVTASQPSFTMIVPIWGTAFNAPSAYTKIPF